MRFVVFAVDFDGTLAQEGSVADATVAALQRLRDSGRRLVIVTGRELDDLRTVFPRLDLFERIVAENGALLYEPATQRDRRLGDAPSEDLVRELETRGVAPLSIGASILATLEEHRHTVLAAIADLGLENHLVFNKGALMILPSGVNKASGLEAALDELKLSRHNTVAMGDGENDHALLDLSECGWAVASAIDALKKGADAVCEHANGEGVREVIARLLADDLAGCDPSRHRVLLGHGSDGTEHLLSPFGTRLLAAGPSGSGKSSTATALIEQVVDAGYQACILDPEGDYDAFEPQSTHLSLGDGERYPQPEEVRDVLAASPMHSVSVNLVGLLPADRPAYLQSLLAVTAELHSRAGRPHWLVLDEAHHFLPAEGALAFEVPAGLSLLAMTLDPGHVAPEALQEFGLLMAVGAEPEKTLGSFATATGREPPEVPDPVGQEDEEGAVVVWDARAGGVFRAVVPSPRTKRQRHRRKYAKGELGEESFWFRGPEAKLNLRAPNLTLFGEIARGVDDGTWAYHLRRGDYSRWIRASIKDEELADEVAAVEQEADDLSPAESRTRILTACAERYTVPA